ncbi:MULTISPECIES: aldo/keto reductase family protein [Bacillaceae]|uniref:aldo/keto reductase family protein n=1 Tax=Bacillaceae TaxID=186817 RepID=UPI001E338EAA|nr:MULTISPECIES: aldo/keto reductase family protein [Bacillaceae]MCE4050303.1 aldo/keto reductase family protein [Bacillus sp. Au-Bac7]MCM3029538.1 aldo/keto reductase family protein [Niallia sp. MER 6]UPO87077.1 aldo/keto reductase family protein [Niallia sp. Man26]
MKYRKLGNSGLRVSEIGLGSWLTYGSAVEKEQSIACIHRAYDLGINFFDTANAYNKGAAETVLGEALKDYSRSSYVLATKVFFPMGDGPNDRGLSRKHIMEQCDASLKRLGVDYIDLYQFHRFDSETPVEESLRALDDLTAQGKILYAGVSEWTAAQITDAAHIAKEKNLRPLISNQPIYNMMVRYIEKEVIPVSEKEGIGQVVFSPLAQGILTGKYKPNEQVPSESRAANEETNKWITSYLNDEVLTRVQKLSAIANGLGVELSQLALAWVLRQPNVSSAIIGASRPGQVEENVKASGLELNASVLEEIEAVLEEINTFVPIW